MNKRIVTMVGLTLITVLLVGAQWLFGQYRQGTGGATAHEPKAARSGNSGQTIELSATPTFASISAAPSIVTVNTPTRVTFSAQISDPNLIPGSINLIRLNPGGSLVIGPLQNTGPNTYSIQVMLTEGATHDLEFQVSAALRGVLKRVLSGIIFVTVLPPDPGVAGQQTVAGIDSDNDGVRDDVQRFIATTFPQSEKLRLALRDNARANQRLLTATTTTEAVAAMSSLMRSTECLSYVTTASPTNLQSALSQMNAVEINTEARLLAWAAAQDKASTQAYSTSGDPKGACTFNPDVVAN